MVGSLGSALRAAGGPGKKLSKSGTRASYWASNPGLIKELKKGPSKIIISLNGNGISGTADLIDLISSYTEGRARVIWTGAPPPIRRKKSWAKSLTSNKGFAKSYDSRNKRNETVKDMVEAQGWTFINPYDFIKYEAPKTIGDRTFASGYTCGSCDGIHLPRKASSDYVAKIQGLLA
jgi:hypothetical protein